MKKYLVLALFVAALALVSKQALAIEWTGQVVENYPDSLVFVVIQGEQEVELWLGPEPAGAMLELYQKLQVGDTVKVTFNEEEAIALTLEIVERAPQGQEQVPAVEPQEPERREKTNPSY